MLQTTRMRNNDKKMASSTKIARRFVSQFAKRLQAEEAHAGTTTQTWKGIVSGVSHEETTIRPQTLVNRRCAARLRLSILQTRHSR